MSTHISPKTALKFLQKRLKSLHNSCYNVHDHLLSIRQEARIIIRDDAFISQGILLGLFLLRDAMNSWHGGPSVVPLHPQEIIGVIISCRSDLKEMERWMCWAMRAVRDLRKIGELERDLDRGSGVLILKIGFETEEEIRKVEDEVAVRRADMLLEKTSILRTVGLLHPSTGGNLTQHCPEDAMASKTSVTNPLATSPKGIL